MGGADVIALDEAFHENLPVGVDQGFVGREDALIRRDQIGNVVEGGEVRRVVLADEDETALLADRDGDEAVGVAVEARKSMLVRHVTERAVEAVGPAVITADESLRAARSVGEAHAAMTAGVAIDAHAAVAVADGDDGRSARVARDVGPRFGQCRGRAERHGHGAQQPHLGVQPVGGEIVRDGLAPDRLAHVGRLVFDVIENPFGQGPVVQKLGH